MTKYTKLTQEEYTFLHIFLKYYWQYVNYIYLKEDETRALNIILNKPLRKDGKLSINIPCTFDMMFYGLEPNYHYSINELGFNYKGELNVK